MPRTPQPWYDETKNCWRLRFKKLLPDGRIRRYWHLASGPRGDSKVHALALAKAAQIMGTSGDLPTIVSTIAEAIQAWRKRHPGDYRRLMLRPLHIYAGAELLGTIKSSFLEDYRDWLKSAAWTDVNKRSHVGYSPKSIRTYVSYANAVFTWCAHRDRGYLEAAPDMPDLPKAPRGHRAEPRVRLRAAFAALPTTARPLLEFILLTGCRPSEGCLLRWDQVDLEAGICTLEYTEHKTGEATGRERVLMLTTDAADHRCPADQGTLCFPLETGKALHPVRPAQDPHQARHPRRVQTPPYVGRRGPGPGRGHRHHLNADGSPVGEHHANLCTGQA